MDFSIIQRKVESDEAVSTTLRCEFKCKYHKNPPIKKIRPINILMTLNL